MTPMARRFVLSLILLLTVLLGVHPLPAAAEARWTSIGPDGGTISVLAVAPGARRTVYAGTRFGLLFRSTDAGATWSPTGRGLPWSLTSLLVDPRDPLTLYAGFATMPGFQGFYRSVDGGRTWALLGTGLPATSVWSLAMDPWDPSVLLAGTSAGIFRSEDGGASWSPTSLGEVPFQEVKAVLFDPATAGRAWAARLGSGIFASSDGGRTWTSRNAGIPSTGSVIALAIDPSTGTLYAGLSLSFPGQPLYRSTDAGASWAPVAVEGLVVNALAVSPGPAPAVYAATGSGVFRSADGGVTWTASQGRLGGLVLSLAVPPFPDSIVYAGAFSEGVFKSADRGVSWRQASRGINAAEVRALAVAPSAPSVLYLALYAGMASRTIVRSTDGGATWQDAGGGLTGLEPYLLEVHPRDPRIVWAASYEGQIWKTTNGGEGWDFQPEGEDTACMNTRALVVDPVDPDKVYAAGLRETACVRTHNEGCTGFRTTNGGESWACMKGDLLALAIDPRSPSTLFSARFDTLYRSADAGRSWRDVTSGLPNGTGGYVSDLAVSPRGAVYAATSLAIFRSLDGGATWRRRTPDVPRHRLGAADLAIAPSAPSVLYAATAAYDVEAQVVRSALYETANGGGSWTLVDTAELPDAQLFSLRVHPLQPTTLFAASARGGVYRLSE